MRREQSKSAELVSLMFAIGRFMREEGGKKKKIKGPTCSLLQFETLRYVQDNEKPLMRDVARHFHVTPPAATLLIDGLVREKYLARFKGGTDRRAVRIILTSGGRALLARGLKEKILRLNSIFSALTETEKTTLIGLLRKMAENTGTIQ